MHLFHKYAFACTDSTNKDAVDEFAELLKNRFEGRSLIMH